MRTPFLLIAALIAGQAYANLIPISALRSVSISGDAIGVTYSQTQSSSLLGVFDANLSNQVQSSQYRAQSSASQLSEVTANGASAAVELSGATTQFDVNLSPVAQARAATLFEFVFQVLEPLAYEVNWSRFAIGNTNTGFPSFSMSLSSSLGSLLPPDQGGAGPPPGVYTGTLLPDIYTLRLESHLLAAGDPIADVKEARAELELQTHSIPDTGATSLLLAIAFGAVTLGRRAYRDQLE